MLNRYLLFIGALITFFACSKSGGASNTSGTTGTPGTPKDTTPSAQGPSLIVHWNIFKYVAANFSTAGGLTALPNDTIYPIHSDYKEFTKDSIYEQSWETFSYYLTTPDSFSNSQNRQFMDTAAYTTGPSYYIEPRFAPNDTVFIASLSDTLLVGMQKSYEGLGISGPVLYDLYIYARKD